MISVSAGEGGAIIGDFVGNPSAAGHAFRGRPNTGAKARYLLTPCRGPEGPLFHVLTTRAWTSSSSEDVFHPAEKRAEQRLVVDLRQGVEFLQQFFLALVELSRNQHPYFDIEIALAVPIRSEE